jgi:hypothetical protein
MTTILPKYFTQDERTDRLVQATLLVMVTTLLLVTTAEAQWRTFTPPQGGFSVSFPSEPSSDTSVEIGAAGLRLLTHTFDVETDDHNFGVAYNDLPESLQRKAPSALLDGAVNGAVANIHGRLLQHSEISLGAYPGREFRAQTHDGHVMHVRVFVVRHRVYQIMVVSKTDKALRSEVFSFLESFRLVE